MRLTCLLSGVAKGQHEYVMIYHEYLLVYPAMLPYMQQTPMHHAFWEFSIKTSINFFSSLSSSSSSVGMDHTGQNFLPTLVNEPWPLMTLSLISHCSFLFWDTFDRYWPLPTGNTSKELHYGDSLNQSPSHNRGPCSNPHYIYTYPFSCLWHINFEDKMFTSCLIYPTH